MAHQNSRLPSGAIAIVPLLSAGVKTINGIPEEERKRDYDDDKWEAILKKIERNEAKGLKGIEMVYDENAGGLRMRFKEVKEGEESCEGDVSFMEDPRYAVTDAM